jgi:hypothetical protein
MPPDDNITEIGQGYHAVYHNIQVWRSYGYGVVSGGQVTPGSDGGVSVDVSAGTAVHNGDVESIPATSSLSLASPDATDPRKDLVVYTGSGTVTTVTGTPNAIDDAQDTASRFETYTPSPPAGTGLADPPVVLAEVWVAADSSTIEAADINDLRTDPAIQTNAVTAAEVTVSGIPTSRDTESTLYVDAANGSDSNDGQSAASAFATYERALKEAPRFGDGQTTIRQVGDYTASSPVRITNRKGTIYQEGSFSLRIVGDSELNAVNGNDQSNMETFDGDFYIEGVEGFEIDFLNINGQTWVTSSVGTTINGCYLEGGSLFFAYQRSSLLNVVQCVLDGQANDPSIGIYSISNGNVTAGGNTEIKNWDQKNNTFLFAFGGAKIVDGVEDKYPDAGRSGDIVPAGGRGISDAAFDRNLSENPISGLRQVSNASASDLTSGEWAFDDNRGGTGNAAWLFKDAGGTLHYLDFDGTV